MGFFQETSVLGGDNNDLFPKRLTHLETVLSRDFRQKSSEERNLIMRQEMVGDVPSKALGMLSDLIRKLQQGKIVVPELELFLKRKNPFAITGIKSEWAEVYLKYFGLTVEFADVVVPDDPDGFDRVIFIPKGLTIVQAIRALRKKFNVWTYVEDLDKDLIENVRVADKNYAVRLRERKEADEELKFLSAKQLKERGYNIVTILERLVYEFKYYDETGEHLDIVNWTLCAGSRGSGGHVPVVNWSSLSDKLRVHWHNPVHAFGQLRGRSVVSK